MNRPAPISIENPLQRQAGRVQQDFYPLFQLCIDNGIGLDESQALLRSIDRMERLAGDSVYCPRGR